MNYIWCPLLLCLESLVHTESNQLITTSIVKRLWGAGSLAGGRFYSEGARPPASPLAPGLVSRLPQATLRDIDNDMALDVNFL